MAPDNQEETKDLIKDISNMKFRKIKGVLFTAFTDSPNWYFVSTSNDKIRIVEQIVEEKYGEE